MPNTSTARKLNGSGDYIDFGNAILSNTTITLTQWIKLYQTPSNGFDVAFGYGNTRAFFIWQGATTSIAFNVKIGGSERSSGGTSALSLNTWYLLIGMYAQTGSSNNLSITVYNTSGTQVATSATTQTGALDTTTQPLRIGADPARGLFSACISSECRIYGVTLTPTNMGNLAQQIEPIGKTPLFRAPLMEDLTSQSVFFDYGLSGLRGSYSGTLPVAGVINRNPLRTPAGNF